MLIATSCSSGDEGSDDLLYDPSGPDRDCGDFSTWKQANDFFKAAGGPNSDPHRLDGDNDGVPCEALR
jgi:micrococcal nuclease